LLGVALPIGMAVMLLLPILMKQGIPFYGDENYFWWNSKYHYFNYADALFAWSPGQGAIGPPCTFFSYNVLGFTLVNLFGPEFGVKVFFVLLAALPGIMGFFAARILSKEWGLFKTNRGELLFCTFLSLLLTATFLNNGLIMGATAPSWAYSTLPISIALFVRYIKRGQIKDLLFIGLVSLFALANPLWLYLIFIVMLVYLLIEWVSSGFPLKQLKRSILMVGTIVAFNLYWLLPVASAYLTGASGYYSQYTSSNWINPETLQSLSHWNLLDVLLLGEHSYYYYWDHPQTYTVLSLLIPALAFTTLYLYRKNLKIIYVGLILAIGIFLTKGTNDPFGNIYLEIAKIAPFGAGAILRNPTKFEPLVIVAYGILIGFILGKIFERDLHMGQRLTAQINKTLRYLRVPKPWAVISLALVAIILLTSTYGAVLDLEGYTWPRYEPTQLPSAYDSVNAYLENQSDQYKVMWIPTGGAYNWKPYVQTGFPDLISSKPAVTFSSDFRDQLYQTQQFGKMLTMYGVKYVVYHGDSLDAQADTYLDLLSSQTDLVPVYRIDPTFVSEHADANVSLDTSMLQVINESTKVQRNGTATVTIGYSIPQSLIDQGYINMFSEGFNIVVEGYSSPNANSDSKLFESNLFNQTVVSATGGNAEITFEIPTSYPTDRIFLFGHIYGSGYVALTPTVRFASIEVTPEEYSCPFIIFENTDYRGQIFSTGGSISYDLDEATLIELSELSGGAQYAIRGEHLTIDPSVLKNMGTVLVRGTADIPIGTYRDGVAYINAPSLYNNSIPVELSDNQLIRIVPVFNPNVTMTTNTSLLERELASHYSVNISSLGASNTPVNVSIKGYLCYVRDNRTMLYPVPYLDKTIESNITASGNVSVSFNNTLPSDFMGTNVIFQVTVFDKQNLYLGSTYSGMLPVSGLTRFVENGRLTQLHIVKSNYTTPVFALGTGGYQLAAKFIGEINVANVSLSSESHDWTYGSLDLNAGPSNMTIQSDEAYIELIALTNGLENSSPSDADNGSTVSNAIRVNNCQYDALVNLTNQSVVILTEPYDPLWRCTIEGRSYQPIMVAGNVLGFVINGTSAPAQATFYYSLQDYFVAGYSITAAVMIIFPIAMFISYAPISRKLRKMLPPKKS
jgi:hypothetical protein